MLKLMANVLILKRLKRDCSAKWIVDQDTVFVFKEFYPAVAGYLDQLSESRDGAALGRAMLYVKAATTPGFQVGLGVINAILNLTKPGAKKLQGIKKLFLLHHMLRVLPVSKM